MQHVEPVLEGHAVVDHRGQVLAGSRAADVTVEVLHEVATEGHVD